MELLARYRNPILNPLDPKTGLGQAPSGVLDAEDNLAVAPFGRTKHEKPHQARWHSWRRSNLEKKQHAHCKALHIQGAREALYPCIPGQGVLKANSKSFTKPLEAPNLRQGALAWTRPSDGQTVHHDPLVVSTDLGNGKQDLCKRLA